ncbi:unnamed protein product, partial [Urochloa humidicola]
SSSTRLHPFPNNSLTKFRSSCSPLSSPRFHRSRAPKPAAISSPLLRIRRPPPIPSLLHDPPPSPINMDSEPSSQNPTDMTAFVQNLLGQMQTRFESMSQNIVSKIDEMGTKIDELEQSINDLKSEMGTEMPAKKPEEAKPADSA